VLLQILDRSVGVKHLSSLRESSALLQRRLFGAVPLIRPANELNKCHRATILGRNLYPIQTYEDAVVSAGRSLHGHDVLAIAVDVANSEGLSVAGFVLVPLFRPEIQHFEDFFHDDEVARRTPLAFVFESRLEHLTTYLQLGCSLCNGAVVLGTALLNALPCVV
jgi:hypothetical protein